VQIKPSFGGQTLDRLVQMTGSRVVGRPAAKRLL
jgi:hypothetical protein